MIKQELKLTYTYQDLVQLARQDAFRHTDGLFKNPECYPKDIKFDETDNSLEIVIHNKT